MKNRRAFLLLLVQCLLVSSCSLSNPSVVTSAESSYVFSTGSLESSQNSSSVKNEEDQPLYTDVIVDQEYTGTYEPEEWSLQVETPEDIYEPFSGPVTLREVDESEIINPIIVSGKFPMPLITNDGEIQELMSTVNENVPFTVLFNADYHAYTGMDDIAHPSNMHNYYCPIPISFLRNTAPGCYYTVNKVVNGGYMYLFFERPYDNYQIVEESIYEYLTEDLTDVRLTGGVYMEKVLSRSDFSDLKIGDTIDDVIAMDHAANMIKVRNDLEYLWSYKGMVKERSTVHLLTDGLLTIVYELKGDVLYITDIIFDTDFIFYPPFMGYAYPKYYGILPQDYPPET